MLYWKFRRPPYEKLLTVIIIVMLLITACNNEKEPVENRTFEDGKLAITFDYEKISGYASNQFAVWIEDIDGTYINTLYATKWTAQGGYKSRPDSIPLWVEKSGLDSMKKSDVDAVSGATPKVGNLEYSWNLTDTNGEAVPHGEYKFFVEGTLRWANRVIYSGIVEIGDNAVTVVADSEFIFTGTDNQTALNEGSHETAMIGAVTADFTPNAY